MSRRMLLRLVLFAAALVVAVTMALLPDPPQLALEGFGDKYRHMTAFAVLSLLAARAFPSASLWRVGERLSFLGAMIEVVQSIPALHRDCDILDWLADTAAIAVALLLVAAIRSRRRAAT
ncbi:hypothetical protein [Sphingomonas sp.]|jgi:hypothetical protein|uniref:hypothetical protein n=1 Tax=Sphingomonas sp. TaxID=28214 RepID=UPI0035C7FB21